MAVNIEQLLTKYNKYIDSIVTDICNDEDAYSSEGLCISVSFAGSIEEGEVVANILTSVFKSLGYNAVIDTHDSSLEISVNSKPKGTNNEVTIYRKKIIDIGNEMVDDGPFSTVATKVVNGKKYLVFIARSDWHTNCVVVSGTLDYDEYVENMRTLETRTMRQLLYYSEMSPKLERCENSIHRMMYRKSVIPTEDKVDYTVDGKKISDSEFCKYQDEMDVIVYGMLESFYFSFINK